MTPTGPDSPALAAAGTRSAPGGADTAGALDAVLSRVRIRARRRVAWLRSLWSEEGAAGGADTVLHGEVDAILDDLDSPVAEAEWYARTDLIAPWNRELERVERQLRADGTSRLARLVRLFRLDPKESDLLQACVAGALDPRLLRVYAYLQDDGTRAHVTEELAARLFGHGRASLASATSPLRAWEILHEEPVGPGRPASLRCDPVIREWLEGGVGLDPVLASARGVAPLPPLAGWPIEETAARLRRALERRTPGAPLCVRVQGQARSGRRTFAAAVAARLGLSLLAIHADPGAEPAFPALFRRAQRHALLHECALAWSGAQALDRTWPNVIYMYPIQFLICEPGEAPRPLPSAIDLVVELPPSDLEERRALFRRYVPQASSWPDAELTDLLARHRLPVGDIASAGAHAAGDPAAMGATLRAAARHRMEELAEVLECPFEWDDLVLSPWQIEALRQIAFEAHDRGAFWEQPAARRLFPQGRGLIGLFTGPPGTGKTMSAQVIARSLGLDLLRIDLSAVVSKYVGETSKNIRRIFARAAGMDAVLLFDEADALFGRRTEIRDAHDRFANTDTNYLLQAIESYPGVCLLASNKKGNIDAAFIRRLRYVVEFPAPDAEQRLAIWQRVASALAGPERAAALAPHLRGLSQALELSGAQIKLAFLSALFLARRQGAPLALAHLMSGVERELAKEGRGLSRRDRERMAHDGAG